ncbi:putative mRNA cap guanine-N7 methyltransferase [Heterosigma akashiwo virus 01]|uniref:Putative mRNA cap guanine-N7 methyltransferase n=1 Tax=Heterosigma akashiwo virus 01 TaxID=97195 RepID=A0A1C9C553_HAV01|nr:putative mRNA cap guanine-N7 methyltransferase [Heterosigma akashiwo virus 01]AOM63421.1 putative mRNA cap guanine-N7 methyltransferase [Heterosigma akashiwo virus 01]
MERQEQEQQQRPDIDVRAIINEHNIIKKHLYEGIYVDIPYRFPPEEIRLLDLSTGHGNDLHKWYFSNYRHVVGIDIYEPSIREAKQRFKNLSVKTFRNPFSANFIQGDLKNEQFVDTFIENHYDMNKKFDAISMNNAIHYFFDKEKNLETLMSLIGNVIKPGGYFFGLDLDGKRIIDILNENIVSKNYSIEPSFNSKKVSKSYGNKYMFTLNTDDDNRSTYFSIRGKSTEYLVDIDELERVANKFGMKLLKTFHISENKSDDLFYIDVIFMFQKHV